MEKWIWDSCLHRLLVLTAELVSLYFAVRWREWSHYYYQVVVVWDEKEGDADSRPSCGLK